MGNEASQVVRALVADFGVFILSIATGKKPLNVRGNECSQQFGPLHAFLARPNYGAMDLNLFTPSDVAAAITNHAEAGASFCWLKLLTGGVRSRRLYFTDA
jgi:hypothetical protein